MDRRAILKALSLVVICTAQSKQASAAVPAILMWLWRASTLFRGQAATAGIRLAASNAGRYAVSSSLLAMRASRAAAALRAVTVVSISAIATDEVLAQVQGTPEDSILRWIVAYYAVLTQSDSDAAMGMWSEPPDPRHFRHLDRVKPIYRITRLEQQGSMEARAWVIAQNPGERSTRHVVDLVWQHTDHGPRISTFRSIA